MKRSFLFLMVFLFVLVNFAAAQQPDNNHSQENKLMNQPMPEFTGQTLSGKKIDKAYFKGKVTLLNFMYIGCMPCMQEIAVLNQIHSDNKANPKFQVLGISANTAGQLQHFNSEDTTIYSRIRRILKAEPIVYDLMAGCEKEKVKPANTLGAECKDYAERFFFNGHPITFLIDKKGIVRKVYPGFKAPKNQFVMNSDGKMTYVGGADGNKEFLMELQADIDSLQK